MIVRLIQISFFWSVSHLSAAADDGGNILPIVAASSSSTGKKGSSIAQIVTSSSNNSSLHSNPLRLNLFSLLTKSDSPEGHGDVPDEKMQKALDSVRKEFVKQRTMQNFNNDQGATPRLAKSLFLSRSGETSSSDEEEEELSPEVLNELLSNVETCARMLVLQEMKADEERRRAAEERERAEVEREESLENLKKQERLTWAGFGLSVVSTAATIIMGIIAL